MKNATTWVGMDAHKKFIAVAVKLPGREGFTELRINNERQLVRRLAKKLVRMAPGEVRCCYEAGPCGYALKRQMEEAAPLVCEVIAPSLIPVKPGERIKTDKRDAKKLAELLRANLLTEVHPPTEQEEALKDLCRCRENIKGDLARARHQLSKLLLRRGLIYNKNAWTCSHLKWLRGLHLDDDISQAVFENYLQEVERLQERLQGIAEFMDETAKQGPWREPVAWLRCFHGIDTVTAMTIVAELHDFRRFTSPSQLMGYIGMVPSEHSSVVTKRGGITKAGNSHVRRVLVEAAHHYRHKTKISDKLRKRRQGQPAEVIAVADKARLRLSHRYRRLVSRGKERNKVVVAIARELAGFIWAVLHERPMSA
jgi:transposase